MSSSESPNIEIKSALQPECESSELPKISLISSESPEIRMGDVSAEFFFSSIIEFEFGSSGELPVSTKVSKLGTRS